MRYLALAFILLTGFGVVGCTSAQVQSADSAINKVVTVASNAITTLDTPANIAKAKAAIAAVVSTTGPLHQAALDAQKALNALDNNQATVADVQAALAVVQSFTAQQTAVVTTGN
jgi:hypothetical protein